METNIHYPTESSLLHDGLRKIIQMCVALSEEHGVAGWRQHDHLLKKVKKLNRNINRIAVKKGPHYKKRMQPFYQELLRITALVIQRACELCLVVGEPQPNLTDMFGANTLQAFIVRTERVADTAKRRVLKGETAPSSDKLFSVESFVDERLNISSRTLSFTNAARQVSRFSLVDRFWCLKTLPVLSFAAF
jgi:IS5 family transposase